LIGDKQARIATSLLADQAAQALNLSSHSERRHTNDAIELLCYNITTRSAFVDNSEPRRKPLVTGFHPLLSSLMARSALLRLAALLGILGWLWLAISWAVSLP
jgi:hypothetical protein